VISLPTVPRRRQVDLKTGYLPIFFSRRCLPAKKCPVSHEKTFHPPPPCLSRVGRGAFLPLKLKSCCLRSVASSFFHGVGLVGSPFHYPEASNFLFFFGFLTAHTQRPGVFTPNRALRRRDPPLPTCRIVEYSPLDSPGSPKCTTPSIGNDSIIRLGFAFIHFAVFARPWKVEAE